NRRHRRSVRVSPMLTCPGLFGARRGSQPPGLPASGASSVTVRALPSRVLIPPTDEEAPRRRHLPRPEEAQAAAGDGDVPGRPLLRRRAVLRVHRGGSVPARPTAPTPHGRAPGRAESARRRAGGGRRALYARGVCTVACPGVRSALRVTQQASARDEGRPSTGLVPDALCLLQDRGPRGAGPAGV